MSFYALGFTDPTVVSEDWGGVRELAKHYVQLIRKEQRHGPYFLGGYSYGGLLAYEIASLLTEKNQKVAFVAMIDTFPWFPHSRTISARLVSMQQDENSQRKHVKVCERNFRGNHNSISSLHIRIRSFTTDFTAVQTQVFEQDFAGYDSFLMICPNSW